MNADKPKAGQVYIRLSFAPLRKWRRKLGLAQRDVADALGVTQGCVSRWEQDPTGTTSRCMSAVRLVQLARWMGLPVWELFAVIEPRETK